MTDPQMTLQELVLGQVPRELVGHVSQMPASIEIVKGAYARGKPCGLFTCGTRIANLTFRAYYACVVSQTTPPSRRVSKPVLHCQGELLGICGEPHPSYDCFVCDWTSVRCRVEVKQAIYINGLEKTHGPWVREIALLDSSLLAKREYPSPTLEPLSHVFFIRPGDVIVIAVSIKIETKLEGEYSYLYFSSRCDSEQFVIELPSSYTLAYIPPEP